MNLTNNQQRGRRHALVSAILPCAVTLALAACGGGGGTRSTPPPITPTTPPPTGGLGFTPNVSNDASLVVNPPAIPTQGEPITFVDPSLNRHLSLINAQGALGADLKGQGITIGIIDSGINRNHPALNGRVTSSFIHVGSPPNDLTVDDKVGHGTTVSSLAAGRPVVGNYLNQDGTNSGRTGVWGGGVAQSANVASSRIIGDSRPVDDGSGGGNEIAAGQGYGDFFKSINAELANAGAKVLNNSWGGLYWSDPALTVELANAWKDFVVGRGGIVVFANGNSGGDARFLNNPSDNAALPSLAKDAALEKGWITVGALDPDNPTQLTSYSQQCGIAMNYCLVAPGNVVFVDPKAASQATSGLYQGGGTSYSAPAVNRSAFIDAAGNLQQSSSIANADFSLRSLSGELHGASAAMTFDGIDAGRRTLDGRIDRLAHARNAIGGWSRDLASSGALAQGGYDSVGLNAAGEMIGNDWRVGRDAVVGIAMNRLEQSSWLSDFGDRSRGRQREMQLYGASWRGDWYGQAQVALGSYDRQLQRNLLLGSQRDAVSTQLSGHYASAFGEVGRRFDAVAGLAVTPYLGSQFVRIGNDGFKEASETGFGLRANAWDSSRWQGFAGVRADRGWRVGGLDVRADMRAEWQQTLASRGQLFDASFTGLEQWAPLQGIALGQRSSLFGIGLSANAGGSTAFRFDLSRRSGGVGTSTLASLQALYRF